VHVRVARGAAQIAGGAAGVPRCLQLVVTDHGCGIDPAALPHVFEPFFTTKPIGKGTGLGLSVAQGIVIDHGGWIAIDNAPGGGTRATIVLPQSPHAADNSPPATAAAAPSIG
jgi:signal transduction histidine kinase